MPLPDTRRQQLDGIVKQMISNKESDSNVQTVVNDFVSKYQNEATLPQTKPKKDLLAKATDIATAIFPGTRAIGESLGTAALNIGKLAKGQNPDIPVDNARAIGGYVSAGAQVAGFGGAGVAGSFTQRILTNLGLGAAISGGATASEGGGVKDITKSAAIGGAVGAAIPVVGAGLKAIGKQIEQLPARFVNSALSRSKAEVLNDIAKDKVDDFAKYVVENKPIGSAKTLLSDSMANIEAINKKVSESLAVAARQSGAKATIGRNNLLDQVAKLPEAEGALLKRADIQTIIEKLAPQAKQLLQKESLNLAEANKLRQLVDKTLGDRAFLGGQLSSDKAVLKGFANTLRELVKSKAPEGTRALFTDFANEIRFRDGLLDRIAKRAGNQVLSFGDFIGGGLGGIFGGGIPGAVAGVTARRVIESVPFKIGGAKVVDALTKAAPVLEQLAPAQQTAILNLFADIFSVGTDENKTSPQE